MRLDLRMPIIYSRPTVNVEAIEVINFVVALHFFTILQLLVNVRYTTWA